MNWVTEYSYLESSSSVWSKYLAALYWSAATLSTLGYGDIVPTTDIERVYVVFATIIGASAYAYMIGNVCGIVAGLDEEDARYAPRCRVLGSVRSGFRDQGPGM